MFTLSTGPLLCYKHPLVPLRVPYNQVSSVQIHTQSHTCKLGCKADTVGFLAHKWLSGANFSTTLQPRVWSTSQVTNLDMFNMFKLYWIPLTKRIIYVVITLIALFLLELHSRYSMKYKWTGIELVHKFMPSTLFYFILEF